MFEQYIKKQLNRIKKCSQANMLEQAVFESFKKKLQMLSNLIIESTLNKCIADEVGQENPYAAMIPDLVTEEERQKALASIQNSINNVSGTEESSRDATPVGGSSIPQVNVPNPIVNQVNPTQVINNPVNNVVGVGVNVNNADNNIGG